MELKRLNNLYAKNRVLILVAVVAIVLVGSIGIFLYINKVGKKDSAVSTTSVVAKVDGLEEGVPLTLTDANGNVFQLENGVQSDLAAGQYTLQAQVDGVGGLEQNLEVKPDQVNSFDLKLEAGKQLADSGAASAIKLVDPVSSVNILSQDIEQQATQTQSIKEAVSVVVPNQVITTQQQNSAGNTSNFSSAIISNVDTCKNQSDLKVVSSAGQTDLIVDNCQVFKSEFDAKGENLRYFKVCPESGENGFYNYNLATKKESQLITTSDPVNQIRTDLDPKSDTLVYVKKEGEFGIVKDGKVEVIIQDSYFSSPQFSPDGKYLLVIDNFLARPENASLIKRDNNLYNSFGLKVRVVEWSDLVANKAKANFKELGTTYYIPRPDNYDFEFWKFLNNETFMVGDSPKVFSVDKGVIKYADDSGAKPGRIYEAKSGVSYREYQGAIYLDDKVVLSGVSKVLEINDNLYFLVNGYLFRLQNNVPIQAYQEKLMNVFSSENKLFLVNQQGKLLQYQF